MTPVWNGCKDICLNWGKGWPILFQSGSSYMKTGYSWVLKADWDIGYCKDSTAHPARPPTPQHWPCTDESQILQLCQKYPHPPPTVPATSTPSDPHVYSALPSQHLLPKLRSIPSNPKHAEHRHSEAPAPPPPPPRNIVHQFHKQQLSNPEPTPWRSPTFTHRQSAPPSKPQPYAVKAPPGHHTPPPLPTLPTCTSPLPM